jgi:hypothetical protein
VQEKLPKFLTEKLGLAAGPLASHEPLQIMAEQGQALKSFKERWNRGHSKQAVATTSMYEAGANLAWVDPVPGAEKDGWVASADPGWTSVRNLADTLFKPGGCQVGFDKGAGQGRVVFPSVVVTYVTSDKLLDRDDLGGVFKLLGAPGLVYAWWLAVFEAIKEEDVAVVKTLWECALTVTVRVHVEPLLHMRVLQSLHLNEQVDVTGKNLRDTFVLFGKKVRQLTMCEGVPQGLPNVLKWLSAKGVRFNGAIINKTMLNVVELMSKILTNEVETCLTQLDREFGQETLSMSYNKLGRFIQVATKTAPMAGLSATEMLLFLLEAMQVTLQRRIVPPKFFTSDVLDKQKNGAAGWLAMTATKCSVVQYIFQMTPGGH